ncbi:MAG: tRNA (adenosine(37)-N6)-threonylcarbamoyltransferase complex dimerization subunit type 1 TsaB [Alphaproteobacteria bacterium]|nr:tRNA (adenosine(37)-N6)-threonylcarbamoyltransferase complex dimerization subunit type 1 TsaB [Alphaproteobacteria bacterium]
MLVLSLDTSANFVSVAVLDEVRVFAVTEEEMQRGQAEALIPMIKGVVEQAHKQMSDIDAIAVTVGPGSFTGVRIGLAAARAFGLALNVPVFGVTCFEAWSYHLGQPATVVLDSKRDDYFIQSFDVSGLVLDEPSIKNTEQLKELLPFNAVGTGALKLAEEIGCNVIYKISPISIAIGRIALARLNNPMPPEPLYMRPADVTI